MSTLHLHPSPRCVWPPAPATEDTLQRVLEIVSEQQALLVNLNARAMRQETRLCALADRMGADIGQNTKGKTT